ncbi:DNA translocase FtsK [Loigolactobacillus backii]|uniref:DNA translocase FtsK n=1 Tax=Loigolactobacillus backii TaxID=375175 RepID=UPI0009490588|nr:DNA translocase FtsK [Loigolactobacillus backii]MDA5386919.1 DNA translocase FtsK [Loigolactobacillus backii]MDA5389457.1 DNA translocase FtsK [Loigolactobacillus backii]OLF70317.1 cell division protein FtsK [Loigolactobacillus backii]PIO88047.1 cell division protein FtsK [Loigolactobacillus backii]
MNHYDGPVFLRWQARKQKQRVPQKMATQKIAQPRVTVPNKPKVTAHRFRPTYVPQAPHQVRQAEDQRLDKLATELETALGVSLFFAETGTDSVAASTAAVATSFTLATDEQSESRTDVEPTKAAIPPTTSQAAQPPITNEIKSASVEDNKKVAVVTNASTAASQSQQPAKKVTKIDEPVASWRKVLAAIKAYRLQRQESPAQTEKVQTKVLPEVIKTSTKTVATAAVEPIAVASTAAATPNITVKSIVHESSAPVAEEATVTSRDEKMPQSTAGLKIKKQVSLDDQHYQLPPLDLLPKPVKTNTSEMSAWVENQRVVLNETLNAFNVKATVARWSIGPAVTQFEISLARGVKVSKITNLSDDLKLALAAKDIRIEAPIPGKSTVGIEIPNLKSRPVMLSEVVATEKFKASRSPLTIALGVDLFGQPMVTNIAKMPHGLIAGATGSGKSVFINSLLLSILFKAKPSEVKLLLIDPKAVELAPYNGLPHLLSPVISDPKAASASLKWAVEEMENRYQKLAAAGVRNLEQFNQKAEAHGDYGLKLPYIVIIIDELADLMMVASTEVQDYIVRITQKARAAGIHLIVATQRPSVDIITGTIKNNIPTRIAFMVSSQIDSRTIIDQGGAERLLGRGDMLYLGNGQSQPIRIQGTYAEPEIDPIVAFVKKQLAPHYLFEPDGLLEKAEEKENQDELYPQVLTYIANEQHVSTSKLQREFKIGYNRAASLIDDLESSKFISPASGSKPRDVYLTPEDLAQQDNSDSN